MQTAGATAEVAVPQHLKVRSVLLKITFGETNGPFQMTVSYSLSEEFSLFVVTLCEQRGSS